jgi:hypothetical protein
MSYTSEHWLRCAEGVRENARGMSDPQLRHELELIALGYERLAAHAAKYHSPVIPKSEVKYPEIEVELGGHDGNAFAIIGTVISALREANVPAEEIRRYREESVSGDYDHLLSVAMRWVTVS